MSALGLKIIDESVQQANLWINEVDYRVGWANKQRAYRLLRATLHAVRDHLGPDEAAHLAAQMPLMIRGLYYEGWNPSKTPVRLRGKQAFIDQIQKEFATDPMGDAEIAIGAVLDVLDHKISAGEMDDIRGTFSKEIRSLFAD